MSNWEERNRRLDVFENTLQVCERELELIRSIEYSRANTILWEHPMEEILVGERRFENPCRVEVKENHILEEARNLKERFPSCRIAVLNAASPIHSGGSVIRGGDGAEESLCRCTTLYPCLNTEYLRQEYYKKNYLCGDVLYREACIYTPSVICIKSDEEENTYLEKKGRFILDVISCTPPDVSGVFVNHNWNGVGEEEVGMTKELEKLLSRRIEGVIKVSVEHKVEVLVLSTFGCGFFVSSPNTVMELYKKALQKYSYFFRAVHLVL